MSSSNSGSSEQVEHLKLEKLKRLRRAFVWKFENHRYLFLENFGFLIDDWEGRLPDLYKIFTKEEMDWILVACIESICRNRHVVEFVARSGYRDQPDLDENGKPISRRTTAVHQIAKNQGNGLNVEVLKDLFQIYDKFHVNYIDETGYTHLYVACRYGLHDVAEKFLDLGQDPDYLVPGTGGESLLHFFAVANLAYPKKPLVRMLLSHGADPNLTNEDGSSALHGICRKRVYRYSTMKMLFDCIDELQQRTTLLIDAQDKWGDTPLLLALKQLGNDPLIVLELLRRGADPNLANAKGQTALHVICQCDQKSEDSLQRPLFEVGDESQDYLQELFEVGDEYQDYLRVLFELDDQREDSLQLLFDICDENEKTLLRIDARDNEGNTALHLAIARGNPKMIELLLRRGADPGLANEEGTRPLHLVARRDAHDGSTMKLFFDSTNEERLRTVGIDARDDEGRTALEWAVASCCPRNVELLLDRGADASGFVFPTPSDYDRYADIDARSKGRSPVIKLVAATGLLAIVELLEKRGYGLDRDAALKLMGYFDQYELFLMSRDEPDVSPAVDYWVDFLFKEMAKKPTYMDDFEFASSCEQRLQLPRETVKACCLRLCEKVSTKFFRDWALDPFMELIHYRLPIECGEMVIEELRNQDLYNICLAATGRSSRQ